MMTKSKQLKSFYRRLWLSAGVIGLFNTQVLLLVLYTAARYHLSKFYHCW